jgi:hypothetical protein
MNVCEHPLTYRCISNVIVYLSFRDMRTQGNNVSEDVMLSSVHDLEGHKHVIIFNNYFTSPKFILESLRRDFLLIKTVCKS